MEMFKDEFLSCELSYRLGELGFDKDTEYVYFRNIYNKDYSDGILLEYNEQLCECIDNCKGYASKYNQIISAITLDQARIWLRNEKKIEINIIAEEHEDNFYNPPRYFVMYNGEFFSENFHENLNILCGKYEKALKLCVESIIYKLEDLKNGME